MIAKGMLRLVQIRARTMNIKLPENAVPIFDDFEKNIWKEGDNLRFSSLMPDLAAFFNDGDLDHTTLELDHILMATDLMHLNEPRAHRSPRGTR